MTATYDVTDSLRQLADSWKGHYIERKEACERLFELARWITADPRLHKDLKDEYIARLTAVLSRQMIELEKVS